MSTVSECIHHWMVGTPGGEEIPARCCRCDAERTFPNISPGSGGGLAPLHDGRQKLGGGRIVPGSWSRARLEAKEVAA